MTILAVIALIFNGYAAYGLYVSSEKPSDFNGYLRLAGQGTGLVASLAVAIRALV